jgi:steroid 5-alpha reductase family enzyme
MWWAPLWMLNSVLVMTGVTFTLSVSLDDYSIVDRLWSILPVYYAMVFHLLDTHNSTRLLAIAVLALLWGIRLTYNFYRKGGYSIGSGEDYRWAEVKSWFSKNAFQVFNFVFISLYQNILLALLAYPAFAISQSSSKKDEEWSAVDYCSLSVCVFALVGETIADQQQWNFHKLKNAYKGKSRKPQEVEDGFLQSGLFRYSRHPNFFCEMLFWWGIYGFSIAPTNQYFNYSVVGAALLTGLFQGSTWITEKLSCRKYPNYKLYQKETSALIPWFYKSASSKSK